MAMEQILQFDWYLLDAIKNLQTSFWDIWMPRITLLGNSGMIWIFLACILLCFPQTRRCGQALAISLALLFLLGNCLLKPLIARPRPFMMNPELSLLIPPPSDFSFPSGHTYAGFAATTVLWHHNRIWGIATLIPATCIAFTRLYLMVHFPTDILGGIMLGIFCGSIAIWAIKKRRL